VAYVNRRAGIEDDRCGEAKVFLSLETRSSARSWPVPSCSRAGFAVTITVNTKEPLAGALLFPLVSACST